MQELKLSLRFIEPMERLDIDYMITGSIAPPEYFIIRKLTYYKEGRSRKHLKDIYNILQKSNEQIDYDEIKLKIEEQNLTEEWKLVK